LFEVIFGIHEMDPEHPVREKCLSYAGGSTGEDIGKWFDQCIALGLTVAVVGDSSRFDAHVSAPLLEMVHWVMTRFFDFNVEEETLHQVLGIQKIRTTDGTTLYVPTMRMTGDNDTAVGNTIIQMTKVALMLISATGATPIRARFLVMGDDVLGMFENLQAARVFVQSPVPGLLGFEDVFSVCSDPGQATFCSKRPCPTSDGTVFIPKLGRWFSRAFCQVVTNESEDRCACSLASEWAATASFVPIMRAIGIFDEVLRNKPVLMDYEFGKASTYHSDSPQFYHFMDVAYGLSRVSCDSLISDLKDLSSEFTCHPSNTQFQVYDNPVMEQILRVDLGSKPRRVNED